MGYPQRGVLSLVLMPEGWIFALVTLIGLAVAIPAAIRLQEGWALSMRGVTVTGWVRDKQITERSGSKFHPGRRADYHLTFDFPVAGGMAQGQALVASGTYRGLALNGPVRVRYLPADPAVNEVEEGRILSDGIGLGLVALVCFGPGTWWLRRRLRLARQSLRLRAEGMAQQVKVMTKATTGSKIGSVLMWRISWADASGLTSRSWLAKEADLPEVGTPITIYADPAGRIPSVWEGDCGTRVPSGS